MLLKKLLAPLTTPPNIAELPGVGVAGGPLIFPSKKAKPLLVWIASK